MNIRFRIRTNLAVSAIAIALICTASSLTAVAQTDGGKPLAAKTLAALVAELKGVVARTATEAGESDMVARKWDARRDLAGKTKLAVINLLFQDVKSSVQDAGTQYQISSIFGMYKMMPDDSIIDTGSVAKAALVNKLVALTFPMHPLAGPKKGFVYDVFLGTEDDESVRRGTARRIRFEGFDQALGKNKTLTPDQKAFVRQNYDQILKITTKITADARAKNLPMDRWLKEGLQESYDGGFTAADLSSLIDFFSGKNGQEVLKYNNMMTMVPEASPPKGEAAKAAESKYRAFTETELGSNWKIAFSDEADTDMELKKDAAMEADPNADGLEIYRPENLNKLFNKFVADNYKK